MRCDRCHTPRAKLSRLTLAILDDTPSKDSLLQRGEGLDLCLECVPVVAEQWNSLHDALSAECRIEKQCWRSPYSSGEKSASAEGEF